MARFLLIPFCLFLAGFLFFFSYQGFSITIPESTEGSDWTRDEARKFLDSYDRVQRITKRINQSLDHEYTFEGLFLPFIVLSILDQKFWTAYGIQPSTNTVIADVSYPEMLKESKIKTGDEVIEVEGRPIQREQDYWKLLGRYGNRAKVKLKFRRGASDWEEEIPIFKDKRDFYTHLLRDTVNWAFVGGPAAVFMTTKTMDFVSNDDELAFILAHEIAHIRLGHYEDKKWTEKEMAVTGALRSSFLLAFLSQAQESSGARFKMPVVSEQTLSRQWRGALMSAFDKKRENEADRMALHYMAKAGFNPEAALSIWERWEQVTSEKPDPGHPASAERYRYLKREVEKIKEDRETPAVRVPVFSVQEPLRADLKSPERTLETFLNARYFRKADIVLECFEAEYLKKMGETPESIRKKMAAGRQDLPLEAYHVVKKTINENQDEALIMIELKDRYLKSAKKKNVGFLYAFRKSDRGWLIHFKESVRIHRQNKSKSIADRFIDYRKGR